MSNENIKQKVNQTMYMNGGNTLSEKSAFRLGAKFGFKLAQQECERLKGLIETAYISGRNDEKSKSEIIGWQQFKTENNL